MNILGFAIAMMGFGEITPKLQSNFKFALSRKERVEFKSVLQSVQIEDFSTVFIGMKQHESFSQFATSLMQDDELSSSFELKTSVNSFKTSTKIKFSIIFCETFNDFEIIDRQVTPENFHFDGFFLIVTTAKVEADEVFRRLWLKFVHKVLVFDLESRHLSTFDPFVCGKCNQITSKVVNSFVNGSWLTNRFFPGDFRNLQNCKIKVSAMDNAPIVIKTMLANGSYTLDGIEVKLIRELGKSLKFEADIESIDKNHGLVFENNTTATGNIRNLISGSADMVIGCYYLTSTRGKHLTSSYFHLMDSTKVVVPKSPKYTPVEKLLRPFEWILFLAVLLTVFVGFLIAFSIQKLTKPKKSSVHPINVIVVFFGGSQRSLPGQVSLRILFVAFSFFCIVIRTVYQGSLFTFMQIDDHKKGLNTLDQMVQANYHFHVGENFGLTTKNASFHNR
jgi:ABC-type amino acid transport substrate-binding protein